MARPTLEQRADRVRLAGELRMAGAPALWRDIRQVAAPPHGGALDIDLAGVTSVDGGVMSLLVALREELAQKGVKCEIVGASERVQFMVRLYGGSEAPSPREARRKEGPVSRVGAAVARGAASVERALTFIGEVTSAGAGLVRRRGTMNWRVLPGLIERAGTDGLLIVVMLNFLVGFVMAFQSARQLEVYGANVYVADVVGISVTRELAPLMTAIIMSGRSGAAFAAEIGTMRVSEEIDALRTMGFAPVPYLVLPRIGALMLAAPVLTLVGDLVGVVGGGCVAVSSLDVSAHGYLAELQTAVFPWDIWTGLLKSVAFGMVIALIGCQQGFATRGAAAGVGRGTTTTVVTCLFTIVIVDTLFTVLFRSFGT